MIDLQHEWGGDLGVSSTGDIALVSGDDVAKQRVFRRLLTNPGDYLWNLDYGGGLSQFVGLTARPADIEAVIRNQLDAESSVANNPVPAVAVRLTDTANGYIVAQIGFASATTSESVQFSLSIGA